MKLLETTQPMKARGEKALVPFFTAGYPDETTFCQLVRTAVQAGCPVIEIGIPFSDPIADGPVIQESSRIALANGMTLRRALELTREITANEPCAPVFMSYINPIMRLGFERFTDLAREAGVTGVIVPDLPLEESAGVRTAFAAGGLTLVDLIAPTSPPRRIREIVSVADGFVYLVSLTGVTGAPSALAADIETFVAAVRRETALPLYVGFGVSTADQAQHVSRASDGVIIGSAIIKLIQAADGPEQAVARVGAFLTEVRDSMNANDGGRP